MVRWGGAALALALLAGGCAGLPQGEGGGSAGAKAVPVSYRVVSSLTTEVGPRLAGSAREAAARDWAVRTLRDLKFTRVAVEPFTIKGWERGEASLEIVSAGGQSLAVAALGGSIATPRRGITADVAVVASFDDLLAAPPGAYAGKIVYVGGRMARARDGSGYGPAVRKRSRGAIEAAKRGAVAVVIRSAGTDDSRYPHTGVMRYDETVKKIPAAAISNADADQIERLAAMGLPVRLKLFLSPRSFAAAPSGNVVADIVGVEKPEQIVLLGAHLDSWDLGTGAIDDGAGVAIVVGAALRAAGADLKPKRTIRVVLFGAEEPGGQGGEEYAKLHAKERHVMATEVDFGAGRAWRFATKVSEADLPFFDAIGRDLESLGLERGNNKSDGGTDVAPLGKAGVPIVGITQDGTTYFDYHHTANDTLDKIDVDALEQNVEAYARVARAVSER